MSKLIAHRGLSSQAFENTEESFLLAANKKEVFGIETDVWLTKDNVFVCAHESKPFADPNSTLEINSTQSSEISKLPLNYQICKYKFTTPHFICTFDRYLEICKSFHKVAVIEIKQTNLSSESLVMLINKVKSLDMLTKTHFISFDWGALKKIKVIEPNAVLFALVDTKQKGNEALTLGFNISIQGNLITRKYIKSIHEKNLLISIWTIDSKLLASVIQKLYKIDFITSNKLVLR